MISEDYVMRQIDMAVRLIARLVFKKDTAEYKIVPDEAAGCDILYLELMKLAGSGEINEAENLLFERSDINDLGFLEVAIAFYDKINNYGDAFLEISGYSREEAKEGLGGMCELFGVSI